MRAKRQSNRVRGPFHAICRQNKGVNLRAAINCSGASKDVRAGVRPLTLRVVRKQEGKNGFLGYKRIIASSYVVHGFQQTYSENEGKPRKIPKQNFIALYALALARRANRSSTSHLHHGPAGYDAGTIMIMYSRHCSQR